MAVAVKKLIVESRELSVAELTIIEHIGEILAEEYIVLLKKGEKDESSDLCPLLERESEGAKHRGSS